VVTIMGHVDHGKTSLLDAIRSTDVASGEAGGITQHISAFKVRLAKGGEVVFLDTPGHEAFTALRARGAKVTDVVVLVVAADDGVMPQTVEAIDHANAAGVPIVVAVNKMDKPGANPARVRQELSGKGLNPEEWGGKTIMVDVSARTKEGVDKLLEMLLLEAELLELKADPEGPAEGTVLEARMHKSRGPTATVLIQHGTLHAGDIVTAGSASGRVRQMLDDKGHTLKEAGPSTPIELLGLSAVPEAGVPLRVVTDEREARDLAEAHLTRVNTERLRRQHITLQDVSQSVKAGETKELHLILKADVQGSLEAVSGAFTRLANEQVKLRPIHEGVGPVNASDIALAAASDAVIIGFNVAIEPQVEPLARQEGVEIRIYDIIYNAIEDLKKAMEGLLAPKVEDVALGRIEVRATFRTPRGTVAGCFVTTGKVVRGEKVRVLRGGVVVRDITISGLRRFKEDVREVGAGYECGLSAEGFNDFQVGDVLEVYTQTLVQEKLRL
jgi:translation initiation factor IF-2